jgi:peptide-methionine (S)-S-oxide reductase
MLTLAEFLSRRSRPVTADRALKGRPTRPFDVPERHAVLGTPLEGPVPAGHEVISFGMGCFWGAERVFWQLPGAWSTAVGYQGGHTPNPTYEDVCSGLTGHAEVVRVVFDPARLPLDALLRTFWEEHDPTQGMRQGNDVGTQYRSAVYPTTPEQLAAVTASRAAYQAALDAARSGTITTEITLAGPFWFAEDHHQQYLHKVPNGYCGLAGTGVACPIGVARG